MIIITIIFWVILIVLLFNAFYFVVFSLSGLGYQPKLNTHANTFRRFTVIFPAYKEDAVILPAVQSALYQQYDSQQFSVWVLADAFQPETCESLRNMGANVIEIPDFSDRNKSKALNYALPLIPDSGGEICVIMDGDNQVAPDFLQRLNQYFQGDTQAVQARRVALNENTDYAVLDSLSESINNHISQRASGIRVFCQSHWLRNGI